MEQVIIWFTGASSAHPAAPAMDEGERDHEGNEEGQETVDDVDGEGGGPSPGVRDLSGINAGELGSGHPRPVVSTFDRCILLCNRL